MRDEQEPRNTAARCGRLRRHVLSAAAALLLAVAVTAHAQPRITSSQAAPSPTEEADPFGRDTPRGTIGGFDLAAHREDFVSAARYMQLTPAQRRNADTLARNLADLLDRYYSQPIAALSDEREGSTTDGLPLDRERIILTIGTRAVPIELVRVKDPQAGLVWLISSESLAQVPFLRRSASNTWIERVMPQALVDARVLGVSVAQWVALAATLAIPLAVLWLLGTLFIVSTLRVISQPAHRARLESWYRSLRWPLILLIAIGIHLGLMLLLGFSVTFRLAYRQIALAVAMLAATWLLWRFMTLSFADARAIAQRRGQAGVRSVLLLTERVCKTLVILGAMFALLTIAGVNTTTALAGVGIGGVAVALGAQRSVENLLGGVFLLTDRALAVGDTCSISNRLGVVEDITMRSVRLRTIEQTLLSVPTGILSESSVENFATRNKILVQTTLRLRYGTTTEQVRRILSQIRMLLGDHPDIETRTARVRLVDFGMRAIELELFAYVLTADVPTFLAVREELLLEIAAIIESSGTGFAQPPALDQEPSAQAKAGVYGSAAGADSIVTP